MNNQRKEIGQSATIPLKLKYVVLSQVKEIQGTDRYYRLMKSVNIPEKKAA